MTFRITRLDAPGETSSRSTVGWRPTVSRSWSAFASSRRRGCWPWISPICDRRTHLHWTSWDGLRREEHALWIARPTLRCCSANRRIRPVMMRIKTRSR